MNSDNKTTTKTYIRAKRGMVFWFDPMSYQEKMNREYITSSRKTYKSSIQGGNRPWLVVSNDQGNSSAPTCNIVPITLEEKAPIPTHVYFNYEGKQQTVLVEQIRTIDIMALGNYIYTVDDEIMEKVERAMTIQFAIRPEISSTDFTLKNTLHNLESIVTSIIQSRLKAAQSAKVQSVIPIEDIEDSALKLGQMIEDLVKVPDSPYNTSQPIQTPEVVKSDEKKNNTQKRDIKKGMSAVDKFYARYPDQTSKPLKSEESPQKLVESSTKRNKWTLENRKQFLEDCDKMSPQEIMNKYHFNSIQSLFSTKYQCKVTLENASK